MSKTYIVRLRGGSYENADGTNRQCLLATSRQGELLTLHAEPDNVQDRNAVSVFNSSGQQLGYLPSDARDASSILRGENITASVFKRIGGPKWWHRLFGVQRSYGLLIRLTKGDVDWSTHNTHREKAEAVDALVRKALAAENAKEPPASVIGLYEVAMSAVIALNKSDPAAAAHRYAQAPINRITLLLFKQKRESEARDQFHAWKSVVDPIGLTKTDQMALTKRMSRG